MVVKRILARPSLSAGILIVSVFVVVAIAAPFIAPPEQGEPPTVIPRYGFSAIPQPPRPGHPLGLLERQYDVFYGLIWGTRVALRVGLVITLGRVLIGSLVGLFSGYFGGLVDAALMRLTDAFLAFPIMAAAMVMLVLFGTATQTSASGRGLIPNRTEQVIMVTLVVFGWMPYARLLRGNVLSEREKEYVHAAMATGVSNRRVIFRHLLPNVTQGLFVLLASDIGAVVVLVAAFTFVGLVPVPGGEMEADWGQMLRSARDWIIGTPVNAFEYWYTYIPVSAAVVLFSVGWNLIGDGLRDLFDPRLRRGTPSPKKGM
jgi:peptide/nickel transport system permease protein